jgi:hypothetical protein
MWWLVGVEVDGDSAAVFALVDIDAYAVTGTFFDDAGAIVFDDHRAAFLNNHRGWSRGRRWRGGGSYYRGGRLLAGSHAEGDAGEDESCKEFLAEWFHVRVPR